MPILTTYPGFSGLDYSVSIHDRGHKPRAIALPEQDGRVSDFDQIGIVVDWLDACRTGDLASLLELYAEDGSLECQCDALRLYCGRDELESYWAPRLGGFASAGYKLEEIRPAPHGVELEYSLAGSLRIRVLFAFNAEGKIHRTICQPARQKPPDCCAC